jgi:hypothetical protein
MAAAAINAFEARSADEMAMVIEKLGRCRWNARR